MSIFIKGIELPKTGTALNLHIFPDGTVCERIAERSIQLPYKAEEIPVPHGRLIDADERIEVQMYDEEYEEWTLKTTTVADYLCYASDMAPVIIDAEEGIK